MNEEVNTNPQEQFGKARQDIMVAAAIAAVLMIGAALFAPIEHLWGVVLGTLLAIANLSALARLVALMLENEGPSSGAALKVVAKMFVLMFVVIAVLFTRPQYALGLSLGLALPAVAGLIIALRGKERRTLVLEKLRANRMKKRD